MFSGLVTGGMIGRAEDYINRIKCNYRAKYSQAY